MATGLAEVDALLLSLLLGVGMLACWRLGVRLGRRESQAEGGAGFKFDDASLALLGLLLGFTFAMALGKHDNRRRALVEDSNSIGEFYTCASLLNEPIRSELRTEIHDYAKYRNEFVRGGGRTIKLEDAVRHINAMHARMTELVGQAVEAGTPIAVPLTNTLNGVTSSHAARLAAARDRLPETVLYLLFAASMISTFLVGRQQGRARSSNVIGTLSYVLLAALAIYVILDLNQPGRGTIRVSQEPIERLIQAMEQ